MLEQLGAVKAGPLFETIAAARFLGIDATKWEFDQLLEANTTIRDFEARQEELRTRAKAEGRERVVQFVLALILVAGAVGGVFVGILSNHEAAEVAQFLAPITGLAGIAIGYIFGRSGQTSPTTPLRPSTESRILEASRDSAVDL